MKLVARTLAALAVLALAAPALACDGHKEMTKTTEKQQAKPAVAAAEKAPAARPQAEKPAAKQAPTQN